MLKSTITRTTSKVLLMGAAAVAVPLAIASPAQANVGDCKTVYGSGGTSSSGYATICLRSFSSSRGSATLEVTVQDRRNASNNVYVSAGFIFGGYNTGSGRLGPNASTTYTKTIYTNAAGPIGVTIRLCYDKSFQSDPCYTSKVIYG